MATIYLLDRLTPKHIEIHNVDDDILLSVWEKVIYTIEGDDKEYVGQNVWYYVDTDKKWYFVGKLTGEKEEKFIWYQKKSQSYYERFKEEFPKACVWATPVTVRADLQGRQIYFYFYAEERYNFSEFVKSFRAVVPVQFFIYQLGARDMIRYSPGSKDYLVACWCWPVGCCSLWKLPSVEMDNVALQGLEWRDIEKLKWRCWKLKCSIVFERELYIAESAWFPKKGDAWIMHDKQCVCIWHNIMTWDIVAKTQDGELLRWPKQSFHLLSSSS